MGPDLFLKVTLLNDAAINMLKRSVRSGFSALAVPLSPW